MSGTKSLATSSNKIVSQYALYICLLHYVLILGFQEYSVISLKYYHQNQGHHLI